MGRTEGDDVSSDGESDGTSSDGSAVAIVASKFQLLTNNDEKESADDEGASDVEQVEVTLKQKKNKEQKRAERIRKHDVRKKKEKRKNRRRVPLNFEKKEDLLLDELSCPVNSVFIEPVPKCAVEGGQGNIFRVMYRYLRPDDELDRLIGRGRGDAARRNKAISRQAMLFGLVVRRPYWPPYRATGLTMQLLSQNEFGEKVFQFVHNSAYIEIEATFFQNLRLMNVQAIAQIFEYQPYHVNSLIQYSEVLYNNEEYQSAQDCLERAIYSLENSFHPMFSISGGNCFLSYDVYHNRSLFVALFNQMMYCLNRSCRRSALEFAKLILCLDKVNDPLAIVLILDYLFIVNNNYDAVIDLERHMGVERFLNLLPNVKYSVALAYFLKSRNTERDSVVTLGKADKALDEAIIQFPTVIPALLDRIGVVPDSAFNSCDWFKFDEWERDGEGLKALVSVYVQRMQDLWKESETLAWLKRGVDRFIKTAAGVPPDELLFFAELRHKQYFQCPKNVLRHIFLSKCGALPVMDVQIYSYNPFPPNPGVDRTLLTEASGAFHSFSASSSWVLIDFIDSSMSSVLRQALLAGRYIRDAITSIASRS